MTARKHEDFIVHARLPDGLILPVVDVSNPSFRIDDTEASLGAWRSAIAAPRASFPAASPHVPGPSLNLPELAQRVLDPTAGYLDGWATYLMKVGVQNLPIQFSTALEHRLLSSPNALSLRVRLQQIATVMAESLHAHTGSAHYRLLTIGGGTGIEVLNALILMSESAARPLAVCADITILDIDEEGSHLGKAALAALQESGRIPADWTINIMFLHYSWDEPLALAHSLKTWVREGAFVLASSEGALFEYGSDEVVRANLRALYGAGKISVAGSVIRNDAAGRAMAERSPFVLYPRGIQGIQMLAGEVGYRVSRVVVGVATDQFLLEAH